MSFSNILFINLMQLILIVLWYLIFAIIIIYHWRFLAISSMSSFFELTDSLKEIMDEASVGAVLLFICVWAAYLWRLMPY